MGPRSPKSTGGKKKEEQKKQVKTYALPLKGALDHTGATQHPCASFLNSSLSR